MKRLAAVILSAIFAVLVLSAMPGTAGMIPPGVSQTTGSFTPTITFGGTDCTLAGTPCTFSPAPAGNWIRTGNVIFVQVGFAFTALGTGSGTVGIGNFPFTSKNIGADAFGCTGIYQSLQAAADAFYFQAGVAPNTNGVAIRYRASGTETPLLVSHMTSTSYIKMTCEYPL